MNTRLSKIYSLRERTAKTTNIKDILPLAHSEFPCRREAMLDPNPYSHPDTDNPTQYCLGTGLQMRDSNTSHKSSACAYHDVSLAVNGKLLKTMTQGCFQKKKIHILFFISNEYVHTNIRFFIYLLIQLNYWHNVCCISSIPKNFTGMSLTTLKILSWNFIFWRIFFTVTSLTWKHPFKGGYADGEEI